jgi:hypothetical protein
MADPELLAHREWLGYVQPVGVVVSPPALLGAQAYVNRNVAPIQQLLFDVVEETSSGPVLRDLVSFATYVLGWEHGDLSDPPEGLECVLTEYAETLRPSYAVREPEAADGDSPWLMLVQVLPNGADLDTPSTADDRGWQATPEAKFERLLRETQVPTGLLVNGRQLRLVYAPRGETSGYITFPIAAMTEVPGRPVLAALQMLLCADRLFSLPKEQRLPAILADSRRYQNEVSTKLAGQVLAGLYELLRGFQAADAHTGGRLLGTVLREKPDHVYEGLLTVLLRLVFLLYAEDRDLMPSDEVYALYYAVGGLFDRLRSDADRHPDTMDLRYGAWAQLLSLFRIVFDGVHFGSMGLPPRQGHLFDPDRFPFLEGRPSRAVRVIGDRINVPLVSDGVVWRVLQKLVVLDGERLSYRSLDVEQIGSVYETTMGFRLEIAYGYSLAIKPAKPHGAPITINVDELLAMQAGKRSRWVRERADQKLTDREAAALAAASSVPEVEAAIERKIDRRATPNVVSPGAMILQPNEERRRSGSFYTPRSLTEPIVRTTLRPIFERLGDNPTPEAILDLKVCDPAMGSGAFLVEVCRQLADMLVDAWHAHGSVPPIPPGSDQLLHARRLVAHRCLYGVDRNPIAVDLAKLSLWLATLARDHAFTFLDHAVRCGDSLVGLTRQQITAFHWSPGKGRDYITPGFLQARLHEAERLRAEIREAGDDTEVALLRLLLRQADDALDDLRLSGDLIVLTFFEGTKAKERQNRRDQLAQKVWRWQQGGDSDDLRDLGAAMREDRQLFPFHWQIEFPEVFDRERPGFDAVIGNPPFAGKNTLIASNPEQYLDWLKELHAESHGNADLVAHFFRRAFDFVREGGCLGLIATNTIGQGDTRSTGLRWIRAHGGTIYEARKRVKWPLPGAAVIVSAVHVCRGRLAPPNTLNGRVVNNITAYLFHAGGDDSPTQLTANLGRCFVGNMVLGLGFTFDDQDTSGEAWPTALMRDLVEKNPANQTRIFRYVGGRDFNAEPLHSVDRFIVDFRDLSESEARRWPDLMRLVEERVKPIRLENNRAGYRRYWWQHAEKRADLYATIAKLGINRVLARSLTSSYAAFAFLPNDVVFDQSLIVFAFDDFQQFGVLSSRVHEEWARFFGATLKDDPRYNIEDCFESFPVAAAPADCPSIGESGRVYYEFRAAQMIRNDEGLTRTYSRFHNPDERSRDICELRRLHAEMDRVVLDSYGWTDISTDCEFLLDYESDDAESGNRRKPWRYRWPEDVRDEVLARLLALNAERAERQQLANGDRRGRRKAEHTPLILLEEA